MPAWHWTRANPMLFLGNNPTSEAEIIWKWSRADQGLKAINDFRTRVTIQWCNESQRKKFLWELGAFKIVQSVPKEGPMSVSFIQYPHWLAITVFGAYPVVALFKVAWRIAHRRKPHECKQCGYNLTGNTSGVCPECSTATSEIAP